MTIFIPRAYVLRIRAALVYRDHQIVRGTPMWTHTHVGAFAGMRDALEWRQDFEILQCDFGIKSRFRIFDIWPTRQIKADFDPACEDGLPESVADALTVIIPSNHVEREQKRTNEPARWPQYQ